MALFPRNTILQDHWYRVQTTFVNSGVDSFYDVVTTIDDFGFDGLSFQNTVMAATLPAARRLLGTDSELYVSLEASINGMAAVDNLSMVPEPSTLALATLGILGLLIAARRKR